VASVEARTEHGGVQAQVPLPSLFVNLAHPNERHLPKKHLDKDPNYFKNNVMGSGPFQAQELHPRLDVRGRAESRLLRQGPAVLNGYKFFISTETSVRAAAIRSGRAYIEFRRPAHGRGGSIRKHLVTRSRFSRPPLSSTSTSP